MKSFVVVRLIDDKEEFLRDTEHYECEHYAKAPTKWVQERAFACRFFDEQKVKKLVERYRPRAEVFYEAY